MKALVLALAGIFAFEKPDYDRTRRHKEQLPACPY